MVVEGVPSGGFYVCSQFETGCRQDVGTTRACCDTIINSKTSEEVWHDCESDFQVNEGKLVFSCHADTGFDSHRLRRLPGGVVYGQLDNFAGVYAVMGAYFSGRMDLDGVRIELTYGEETGMDGAYEVLDTLSPEDVVVVVDVTGIPTSKDFTVEKCRAPWMRAFVRRALEGLSYELHEDCPDPVADEDECDVYVEKLENVCFLGVPVSGGDYNEGPVYCREASIAAVYEAVIRLAEAFHDEFRAVRVGGP